ncbi:PAS domain S-box [Rivularia sp. PCC 7116]|uniref:PAS domain S-box protein n=1 Tax=Rivularia sp. PCC 7116 TaxID=373994 RepID=UPI00029ECA6F|nr:PAS domain S-box protein [Rivularia sp. PCC 7116]AFY55506.1 PAS domain S-box [Rivularia sp. PCC 7116]
MQQNQQFSLEQAIERNPLIVTPDRPLIEVVQLMSQGLRRICDLSQNNSATDDSAILPSHTSFALVMQQEQIIGIFTERDMVRLIAADRIQQDTTIAEVMSQEVVTLKASEVEDVFTVLSLTCDRKIRHLPIVDEENQLLGVITTEGMRRALHPTEWLRFRRVEEVMNKHIINAPGTVSVLDTIKLMVEHQVSCVVIVRENEALVNENDHTTVKSPPSSLSPIGIITERDIVQFQKLELNLERVQVQEVMSTPLFLIGTDESLWNVHRKMLSHRVRRLVVAGEQGELRGIITETTLLQALDPTEMYGVLELLQYKVERLEVETSELSQNYTEQSQLYEQVQTALEERKQIEKALREERNLVSAILDVAGALIIVLNKQGKIVSFNQACERITGYSFEEVENNQVWDLVVPEDIEITVEVFEQLKRGEFPNQNQNNWVAKDGSRRLISWSNTCLLNDDGSVKYIIATGIDITEKKQLEEDLNRFFTLSLDMLCVAGFDGYFKQINPAFEEILGYTKAELIAQPFLSFIHPDDVAPTLAEMDKLSRGVKTIAFENRYRTKDDSYKWMQWNATAYQQLIYAVARDITEYNHSQAKIHEQAALLDVATDAIMVRGLQNQILFWNQGAQRLYGYTSAEILGKNANELLYRDSPPQLEEIHQVLLKQNYWKGELHQVTKQGNDIVVFSSWSLVRDEQGNPKSMLIVNTDITETKKLEAQFLRAQRLESIGTLSGGIAHDLNNILTPILAISQLLPLKLPKVDEQTQHLFNILEISAKRGATLVKQVLSFARGVQSDRTPIQVKHIISEIQQFARNTFPKSIEIQVDLPNNLQLISADTTQIHQVLMNLCVNARDAMPQGGTLSIQAENIDIDENYASMNLDASVGNYVSITVSDTGMGIPPETKMRIFEPFFTTKEQGKGTGLGLSTTIGIIKSHGGFINVYSEVGEGTKFQVYLPVVHTEETIQDEKTEIPQGNGELILLVDDEMGIRDITKISLENHNYQVLTAYDGIEAIALYAQHKNEISAVLMDMMMPEMDGVTAIRTLQRINPQVKIIAISGLSTSDKINAAMSNGAKLFLSKPYTSEELLRKLHQLLNLNSL